MRTIKVSVLLTILAVLIILVGCDDSISYPAGTPYVEMRVSQAAGPAPLSVGFQASVINVTGTYELVWYFGDDSDPEAGLSVAHIYESPGDYTATCMLMKVVNDELVYMASDWIALTCYGQIGPPLIP